MLRDGNSCYIAVRPYRRGPVTVRGWRERRFSEGGQCGMQRSYRLGAEEIPFLPLCS